MSNDDPYWKSSSGEAPPPPPKKRMSGCLIAALIVGGIGGVLALVCCGVGVWFASQIVPKMAKEPQDVLEINKQIWSVDLPEDFSPDTGLSMDNFFMEMKLAMFKHKEGKGELMVTSALLKIGDKGGPDQTRQFRENFENGIKNKVDVKNTESHEITIDGKQVTVHIGEGTDKGKNSPVHTADATFEFNGRMIFFLIRMDDDIWDEEEVLKMLESAKPSGAVVNKGKAEPKKVEDDKPDPEKKEEQ